MKQLPKGRNLLGKDGNRIDDIFIIWGKEDVVVFENYFTFALL